MLTRAGPSVPKRLCAAVLLAVPAIACSGNASTSPSSTPAITGRTTFSLSGKVTTSTSATIPGANVAIADGPNAGKSSTTDASGNYNLTGLQPSGFTVNVSAADYISQSKGVTLTSNQTLDFSLMPLPKTIVLTGRVTAATTSAPIAGAIVSINGRYRASTDASGNYSVTGLLDYGLNHDFTYVSANGYASDYRYIRGTIQNVHLYPIERVTAGESKSLTVSPDDTLCVNNVQDTPGLGPDYVCRSVRILAPSDGTLTVEALSVASGTRPLLEVETVGILPCCSERIQNPTSIRVTAGTEVVANIEMLSGSTASQSFIVNTSLSR